MSLNNSHLHGFAFVGTMVLAGSLFGATLYLTEAVEVTHAPPLKEMITIEAELARKSEKKRQPQKELKAPEPVKPEGVSRDADKKPLDKPKEDKKPAPKDDKLPDIKDFRRPVDDEPQPGSKPVTDIGQFDGSEKGFAAINSGHPFWRNLKADCLGAWEIPQISNVTGTAVGCFHIQPDGKIIDLKFEPSGDEILDDSVQRALNVTQKLRNDKPQPVPIEQLGAIKEWVCLRFNPKQ